MSDVLPSIIVLAMTTLFVFRCELTTPRARKAPAHRRRKTQQSARSFKRVRDVMRCHNPGPACLSEHGWNRDRR